MTKDLPAIDDVAMEKAVARFGATEDLTLMQRSVVEMGAMYARRHWLGDYYELDPEVAVNCVELAQMRKTQMVLLLQKERDLERIAMEEDISYEEAAFRAIQRDTHTKVNQELERLSKLADQRTHKLIVIADNLGFMPDTIDDAVRQIVDQQLKDAGLGAGRMGPVKG